MAMGEPQADAHRGWHGRGYLPHFDAAGVHQAITYRLADSLPREALERIERELAEQPEDCRVTERRRRIETWLDRGVGSCRLRDSRIAALVRDNWLRFDGVQYDLCAWVVMPNHVHVLIREHAGFPLPQVINAWKSYTAHAANRQLGATGAFWQADYWDRFIRDEGHYLRIVAYIHDNPVSAGLVARREDWPWSSAADLA
jgi:REP element-mobilizing transposase RayT